MRILSTGPVLVSISPWRNAVHLNQVLRQVTSAMSSALVTVEQGVLRGRRVPSRASGKPYYRFLGVPYGFQPVGPYRFKDPQEPTSWSGLLNVLDYIDDCPQGTSWSTEDCLYLNVYTPQLPGSKNHNHTLKPVMVWIHGGGFLKGSGSTLDLGEDYLVDEDIVLVTINYRLGVLGFLSLEGTDVSSNAGFKDQTAALRWVKKNIAQFGGNPDDVTIFGHEAGAVSVSYHLLSPMSRGLFHRAISSSGSALNPWAFTTNPRERAFRLGRILGYNGNDNKELVDFFRSLPADDLVAAQQKALSAEERKTGQVYAFVGTVENSNGDDVFLPDTPYNLLQSGKFTKVPYLAGDCSAEFRESAASLNNSPSNWETLNKGFERYVPVDLGLEEGSVKSRQVAAKIKKYYFGSKDLSVHTVEEFCNMETDIMFVKGVYKTSMDIVRQSSAPVYNYLFSYDGKLGQSRIHGSTTPIYGPSNGDDLTYLFYSRDVANPLPSNSTEMITLRRMVSIWTNFAKTGNPGAGLNIEWPANTATNAHCLNINATLSITDGFVKNRMNFWDNLYK